MAIWSRIVNWFRDLSERDRLINDFNASARGAFTQLSVGTLLEARSKKGNRDFRHECSSLFLPTGFCIKATKGTPLTKEEFEELFTKCRWERCIDSISEKYTLKATGPNGNSIILTLDCNEQISFWTSTEYTSKYDGKAAYAFLFHNDIKIEKTLTAKQKKRMEFATANEIRFKVDLSTHDILSSLYSRDPLSSLNIREEKRKKTYPQYEATLEQQRKILDAMGDDRQERENNEKKDKEKLDKLWISTPVKLNFNEDTISDNKRKHRFKRYGLHILPVADKKWQGKL